jgi:hypothetical protein
MLSLKFKLDWTIILGPLIRIVTEAVISLIEQLAGLLTGPIDCVRAVLSSIEDLMDAKADAVSSLKETASAFGSGSLGDLTTNVEVTIQNKSFIWNPETERFSASIDPLGEEPKENAWANVVSGLEASVERDLRSEIEKPEFNLLKGLIGGLAEAKKYIENLVKDITDTFKSLNSLVGGGLSLQLESLGLMGLIILMIRVVLMIINLLKSGINPSDWCSLLQEHPEMLTDALKKSVSPHSYAKDGVINISGHPIQIKSCIKNDSSIDKTMIQKWISDLGME